MSTCKFFQRLQIARARRASAILVVFGKIYSCLFISNCTRNHVITYTNKSSNHPRLVDLRELTLDLSLEQRKLFPDRGEDDLG